MSVTVSVNTRALEKSLDELGRGQLAFATSRGINKTLTEVQSAVVNHAKSSLTIRRERFLRMSYKITKFSKKRDLSAQLRLSQVGSRDTTNIFRRLETGETKRPTQGQNLAIPTRAVRVSKAGIITNRNRPKNIKNGFKAELGAGKEAIMQKYGSKKNPQVRVMYILRPSVRMPKRLDFDVLAPRMFNQNIDNNINNALADAIRTAGL